MRSPGASIGGFTSFFLGLVLISACATALAAENKASVGFTYIHDEVPERPWSIHIVKIERSAAEFQFDTALGDGTSIGMNPVTGQIQLLPPELGRPVAAINGDFYDREPPYEGDPKGLQIQHGELISAPGSWSCFWLDPAGQPHLGIVASHLTVTWPDGKNTPVGLNERRSAGAAVIYTHAIGTSTHTHRGRELVLEPANGKSVLIQPGQEYSLRVREVHEDGDTPVSTNSLVLSLSPDLARFVPKAAPGDILRFSTATSPSLKGVMTGLGGGPALVHNKKIQRNPGERRHPRSALGWNKDFFYLVEVDGRQPSLSIGMTSSEEAQYMAKLGCDEALNLDGGGSSTLWVLGQIVNSPCEGGERPIANSLILFQKRKSENSGESGH